MSKILIIDGNSLAHRAYHAVPPTLTRSDKTPTNAVFGFCNMLIKLLDQEKPDLAVCAFDRPTPTFRKLAFEEYKAHRKPIDEELKVQMPIIREAADAFGIDVEEMDGYEADDIIGTFAKNAEQNGIDVVIVTGDKDALQLVSEKIHVILTRKGISEFDEYDLDKVYEKYGFEPMKIIDLKAFMGDSSDNIPGVKGVGEKTALQLVQNFGTVEEVYGNLDGVSSARVKKLLEEGRQSAYDSKMLATICLDVPIEFEEKEFAIKKDEEKLSDFLKRQEFKSLLNRLKLNFIKPEMPKTPGYVTLFDVQESAEKNEAIECKLVLNEKDLELLLQDVENAKEFSFEIAIDNKAPMLARVYGVGLLYGTSYSYIPIEEGEIQKSLISEGDEVSAISKHLVYKGLRKIFENDKIEKSCHDSKKFDIIMRLRRINILGVTFDSMIASYLVDPAVRNFDIADVILQWLGIEVSNDKEISSYLHEPKHMAKAIKGRLQCLNQLKLLLIASINQLGMEKLYEEVELKLAKILADVELVGVKIDSNNLHAISGVMQDKIDGYVRKIYSIAGVEFNMNSPKQLSSILFDKLGMKPLKKTKSGYSTDSEVLEALAPQNEIVEYILNYRKFAKLKSTYVDALPQLVNIETGRLHTNYNQTLTLTGRLSSSNPNLQNIPVRTDEGKEIRDAFVSRGEDWVIMSADYSQIELRVLAHISKDPKLMESFLADEDVHTRTAAEVYKVKYEEVTPSMRSAAKSVNFGIVYGISDFGLAKNLGIGMLEARDFIERYFATYKGVKNYMQSVVEQAKIDGYVTTLMNRRRQIPELFGRNRKFGERVAMNTPIQGTAADIIKCAMNNVSEKLKDFKSEIIMQVHDELVLDVKKDEISEVQYLLNVQMESAMKLSVPLKVDVGYGKTWLSAK